MYKICFLLCLVISLTSAGILAVNNDDFLSRFHYKQSLNYDRRTTTKRAILPPIKQTDTDSRRIRSLDFRDYHVVDIPEYHGKAMFKSSTDLAAFRKLLASSMNKN